MEESDQSTRGRQILVFDLTLKGYGHTFTVEEYLEIMKPFVLNIWQEHNDISRTKLILKFLMKRFSSTLAIPVAEDENHTSTSNRELFRATDLSDLYEDKKANLLSSFSKVELNGSGWVLDKIIKSIVKITDYTPLSNVNNGPQVPLDN